MAVLARLGWLAEAGALGSSAGCWLPRGAWFAQMLPCVA